jgi:iron complex transport system substrate-binding protein
MTARAHNGNVAPEARAAACAEEGASSFRAKPRPAGGAAAGLRARAHRAACVVVAAVVAFTCAFSLVGCGSSTTSQQSGAAQQASSNPTDFHNTDIGTGWPVERSLDLQYATQFTVDYFDGGYKLVCLADGTRYLVVPEGGDVPANLSSDIVALKQPLQNIYLAASDSMCLFDALDAVDTIRVSGIKRDDWHVQAACDAMDDGRIVYGGKYNTPDYDLLLRENVGLAVESTMINHSPDVRDKLNDLGIPVFTERSSYEESPLGRTEWVKLYGALLNKEDLADQLFDEQKAQVDAVGTAQADTSVAFFYINSNGAAVVRKPGDYVSQMIAIAGGSYVFDSLADDSTARSTVTMEMEKFYTEAKDADIIIYNATIDGGVSSIDELVAKNSLLANFKAVREGNVWTTDQDMYQQMMNTGAIISDLHEAITNPDADQLTYLRKLR